MFPPGVTAVTKPLHTGTFPVGAPRAGFLLPVLLLLAALSADAVDDVRFESSDGEEFSVTRFAAAGDYLVLWVAPEYGFREAHRSLARQLAARGVEVWQSDLVESLFWPQATSSLKQLDGGYLAELIAHAHRETGKRIFVAGDSYAAMIALRGARRWQQQSHPTRYLAGALLFTPYSFASIPPLGQPPQYLPIAESTNIPMAIFQAQGSATRSEFGTLLQKLRAHEAPVYTRMVDSVMSLFYEDPPTAAMTTAANSLAQDISRLLPLLAQHDYPRQAAPLAEGSLPESGIDLYLTKFSGKTRPPAIRLTDIGGLKVERSDYTGGVTLVNFWATWCPPCVEEIPSLNRLKTKLADRPFELISINYAQQRSEVLAFMEKVAVDFPVLLDIEGDHAAAWQVISYPSTFVIDRQGHIRYGVNAAIDWDSPELIEKLEELMR